jgi:signal transduction histidine kinase
MTRPAALALAIFALTLALTAAAFGLLLVDPIPVATEDRPWFIAQFCFAVGYGSFGVFLASRRSGNPIGWLFQAVALASALLVFADEYSIRGLVVAPGSLPLAVEVDVILPSLAAVVWPAFIPLLLTLYPTGRPASRRWWSAVWASVALALLYGPSFFLLPGTLTAAVRQSVSLHVSNPIGIPFGSDVNYLVQSPALLIPFALALLAVADRWRRSRGDERQQLNWLAAVCLLLALVLVPYAALQSGISIPLWVTWIFGSLLLLGFAFGIPGAMAVAILRYRLYEIDIVLNRALVYGALAAFITSVYVGIVVGIGTLIGSGGRPNLALSIAATAVVALAFQPVREWTERIANRLVYGQRATPYEVLAQFSHRVAGAYANDEVLPRLARVLGEGTGAASATVWIRSDSRRVDAATWPAGVRPVPPEAADRAAAVRHQGEELGELAVMKRPGEPVTPVEEKLLADLAAQAGQVLRNVRLTADLQARLEEISTQAADLRESRQRIVAAQDAERRRLERNIHDGAQQHLVALAVKLRLTAVQARRDAERARPSITDLRRQTRDALETLGALAAGLYPPVLLERGIAAALSAQTTLTTVPVEVIDHVTRRYLEDLEAAVYFCCQEAIQNAVKHAQASRITVRLDDREGTLRFSVSDDGTGFDPSTASRGAGMQNMSDRIAAAGGSSEVDSTPGGGTTVRGAVPAAAAGLLQESPGDRQFVGGQDRL